MKIKYRLWGLPKLPISPYGVAQEPKPIAEFITEEAAPPHENAQLYFPAAGVFDKYPRRVRFKVTLVYLHYGDLDERKTYTDGTHFECIGALDAEVDAQMVSP